jgi:hypothetical protein
MFKLSQDALVGVQTKIKNSINTAKVKTVNAIAKWMDRRKSLRVDRSIRRW